MTGIPIHAMLARIGLAASIDTPRSPRQIELLAILDSVKTVRIETLASVSDEDLRHDVRAAIAEGRDILMVGCAPSDIEILGGEWSAHACIRLDGERRLRSVLLKGALASSGITYASQDGSRALPLAA